MDIKLLAKLGEDRESPAFRKGINYFPELGFGLALRGCKALGLTLQLVSGPEARTSGKRNIMSEHMQAKA